MGRWV